MRIGGFISPQQHLTNSAPIPVDKTISKTYCLGEGTISSGNLLTIIHRYYIETKLYSQDCLVAIEIPGISKTTHNTKGENQNAVGRHAPGTYDLTTAHHIDFHVIMRLWADRCYLKSGAKERHGRPYGLNANRMTSIARQGLFTMRLHHTCT